MEGHSKTFLNKEETHCCAEGGSQQTCSSACEKHRGNTRSSAWHEGPGVSDPGGWHSICQGWDMEGLASRPLSYRHRTHFPRIFSQSKTTQAITAPIRRLSQPVESTVPRLDFSFFCKMVFTNFILSLWGLNEKTIKCSAQCLKFIRPSINKSCYYKQEILEVKSR